jgi:hypothetical protein
MHLMDDILFDVTNLIFAAEYKLWTQLVGSWTLSIVPFLLFKTTFRRPDCVLHPQVKKLLNWAQSIEQFPISEVQLQIYRLWRLCYVIFYFPFTSFLLGSNIFLRTPNAHNLCSPVIL